MNENYCIIKRRLRFVNKRKQHYKGFNAVTPLVTMIYSLHEWFAK